MLTTITESHATTRKLKQFSTFVEQLASQIQYRSLIALRCEPQATAVFRNQIHHQTASRVSFAGTLVDNVDVFGTGKRRCSVDVD